MYVVTGVLFDNIIHLSNVASNIYNYSILTNTNNAPPEYGAVNFLGAEPANLFACHFIL